MRKKAKMEKECLSEKMNCFNHDNDHWKTAPLWTGFINFIWVNVWEIF